MVRKTLHLFVLNQYEGKIHVHKIKFEKEISWVQMFNLPLNYVSEEYRRMIGNTIGKVKEVDVQPMEVDGASS